MPDGVVVQRLLGGLAVDTDQVMPEEMQQRIRATWRRIQERLPGTAFNFDFWTRCVPRRSTWVSCRAVIAARRQGAAFDRLMTAAIQRAYYTQARNPSDETTLVELAQELGLERNRFVADLNGAATRAQLQREMLQCEALHIHGFPGLVLSAGGIEWQIPVDYHDSAHMLETVHDLMSPADCTG